MSKYSFKKGQTVYVLGEYRAKVVSCSPDYVTCDVYEGLANGKKVDRLSYGTGLVEAKRRKHSK
jgi:hypothetical protein